MTSSDDTSLPVPLERLLAACRDGDELAWEALVRAYQGRVLAVARSYAGDPDEARDLVREVLAVTSGPACSRAERLRVAAWGRPAAARDPLLAAHLRHCPACRALAAVVDRLPDELASLRDPPPDSHLTAAVLRRTLPLLHRDRARSRWHLPARLRAWWDQQVERPTLVAELALAVALLLAGTGWQPWSAVPVEGAAPVTLARATVPRLGRAVSELVSHADDAAGTLRSVVRQARSGLEERIDPLVDEARRLLPPPGEPAPPDGGNHDEEGGSHDDRTS